MKSFDEYDTDLVISCSFIYKTQIFNKFTYFHFKQQYKNKLLIIKANWRFGVELYCMQELYSKCR